MLLLLVSLGSALRLRWGWRQVGIVLIAFVLVAGLAGARKARAAFAGRAKERRDCDRTRDERLAALERRLDEVADDVGRLEAAAISEVARAVVLEGWQVYRDHGMGSGWFSFVSPDGRETLSMPVEPLEELLATLREKGAVLNGFPPAGPRGEDEWSSVNLWRARKWPRLKVVEVANEKDAA